MLDLKKGGKRGQEISPLCKDGNGAKVHLTFRRPSGKKSGDVRNSMKMSMNENFMFQTALQFIKCEYKRVMKKDLGVCTWSIRNVEVKFHLSLYGCKCDNRTFASFTFIRKYFAIVD